MLSHLPTACVNYREIGWTGFIIMPAAVDRLKMLPSRICHGIWGSIPPDEEASALGTALLAGN